MPGLEFQIWKERCSLSGDPVIEKIGYFIGCLVCEIIRYVHNSARSLFPDSCCAFGVVAIFDGTFVYCLIAECIACGF